ncbi:hypothetical protein YC2023_043972 [Brassica napus]
MQTRFNKQKEKTTYGSEHNLPYKIPHPLNIFISLQDAPPQQTAQKIKLCERDTCPNLQNSLFRYRAFLIASTMLSYLGFERYMNGLLIYYWSPPVFVFNSFSTILCLGMMISSLILADLGVVAISVSNHKIIFQLLAEFKLSKT